MSHLALLLAVSASAAVVDEVAAEGGRPAHGWVEGAVELPVTRVLDILSDCEGFADWFPDLVESRPAGPGRCAGRTNLPWPIPDRTWVLETSPSQQADDTWEVSFAYVEGSGNLNRMDGRWVLRGTPDGATQVRYEAWVDLGIPMPDVLVAWATRQVLPDVLTGLEDHGHSIEVPGPLGTVLVAQSGPPHRVEVVDVADGAVLYSQEVPGDPQVVGFVDDAQIAWSRDDRVYTADAVSPALGSEVVALCRVAGANVVVTADGRAHDWQPAEGRLVPHAGAGCGSAAVARW